MDLLVIILREIARWIFPGFPAGCGTISELALFTAIANPTDQGAAGWTLDQVRDEVRDVVSNVTRIPRADLDMQRELGEFK